MKHIIKKVSNIWNDIDKSLFFVTIILLGFGLLNIVTASSREAVSNDLQIYYYFYRHLYMIVAGLLLAIVIINFPTKNYGKSHLIYILLGIILIMIITTLVGGSAHRGAYNWIQLPIIGAVQPSEFAKPLIIVALALLFERFYHKLKNPKENQLSMIAKILIVGCTIPFFVFFQLDFGTMLIMLMIVGVMFYGSPISRQKKWQTTGVGIVIVALLSIALMVGKGQILSDEQLRRFDFVNPCSKYEDTGYQICNGFIAINDGNLWGLGIGKSKQIYSYIPEPYTDSVFAILAEEYGFARSIFVFLLFTALLYRVLMISSKTTSIRGRYICLGVATYIFAHILINLGGLFAVMPLTGVPLPFISYGGSFTISLIAALALVQRVHIEYRNQKIAIK